MDPLAIYGVVMGILLVINLTVTYLLTRGVMDSGSNIPALNERAFTAITKTIAVALLTTLSMNRAFDWHWPPEATVGILVIATVITSASPVYWLWLYITKRFGPDGSEFTGSNSIVMFPDQDKKSK